MGVDDENVQRSAEGRENGRHREPIVTSIEQEYEEELEVRMFHLRMGTEPVAKIVMLKWSLVLTMTVTKGVTKMTVMLTMHQQFTDQGLHHLTVMNINLWTGGRWWPAGIKGQGGRSGL